ncbi:YdbL family probable chaperone protein [Desulfocastanea catecholica]
MRKNILFISSLFIFIACSLFMVTLAHTASIKDQMAARIPAINALKDQGVIGENNKGFLEFRRAGSPQQALIQAENSDRAAVYAAIGKNQGASPVLVGERRAKMIAEKGQAGHWFQKPDGSWYQK